MYLINLAKAKADLEVPAQQIAGEEVSADVSAL